MTRLSPETHRLRNTWRPDRHDAARRRLEQFTWRPRAADLRGLSRTALTFVRRASAKFLYNDAAGALILASAAAFDRLSELRKDIAREGETVIGSRHRPKLNPAVREARDLKRRLVQVLRHLDILELAPVDLSHPEKVVQTEKSACPAVSGDTCD